MREKCGSNKRLVIVDLSYPKGVSVNSVIRRAQYQGQPYTLPSITDLTDEITSVGNQAYIWSADLARAYRQLRTCPLSTPLLGITLHDKIYVDTAPRCIKYNRSF